MATADKFSCLIVEDDNAFATMAAQVVRGEGGVVTSAKNLAEAREATAARAFDLVLLDPPFDAGLQAPALAAAAPLVPPGGLVYLESPAALAPADTPPELALARQGRAGAVHYHLLRRNT